MLLPIFRSELQARLLGLLLLNPEREWTAPEIAERLGATAVTAHRELHRALDGGLITRTSIGRSYLYQAAGDSPLYAPLREILERTVGVEAELRRAIERTPGVEAAFIHGSFAKGTKVRPTSDVDVLVLGDVELHRLWRNMRDVERRVGREIDVTTYRTDEFAALAKAGNGFARSVLRGPVTVLVGSEDDLPNVA